MKKMKTILVPLDGPALSKNIIPYVQTFASMFPADIILLHVVSPGERRNFVANTPISDIPLRPIAGDDPGFLPGYGYSLPMPLYTAESTVNAWEREEQLCDTMRQHTETYLNAIATQLRKSGLDVEIDIHFGYPAECIVEAASKRQVTLIAMATRGYSGVRRWILGSTTDRVVQMTTTPVLIVRQPHSASSATLPTIKRILVPLDGSECARQALPIATELATQADAQLRLVRAINPMDDMPVVMNLLHAPGSQIDTLLADIRADANATLNATAGELRQCHLQVSTTVSEAYPAELISEEAARWQSDLIVMATHGYGGLQRWAMGSVADQVLHTTHTPLLLIHAQEHWS